VSVGSLHVVLVGGMAVGKSTVGHRLAESLGRPLRDSDIDLWADRRRSGRDLADSEGVAALHHWEADHLLRALASPDPVVVAAAASVVDDDRCVRALAAPFVAWLRAQPETLVHRMTGDEERRRLGADPGSVMHELMARRVARYAKVADVVVDVDNLSPDAVAATVLERLAGTGGPHPSG
jgi:shikimate kinase